ncbi:MAG: lysylphosphatidylglycerol synthase transmembrane domain-containing protein [Bacteroidales bacterium]
MIKILRYLVFLALGISIIWWFQRDLNPTEKAEISTSFEGINYWILSGGVLLCLASHFLRALRWNLLLKSMHYNPPLALSFMSVLIAYFANLALPRIGEVLRCGILQRYDKVPLLKSLGTVIIERMIDVILFLMAFGLALFLEFKYLEKYVMNELAKGLHSSEEWLFIIPYILVGSLLLFFALCWIYKKHKHKILTHPLFLKLKKILIGFWEGIISLKNLQNPCLFVAYSLGIWLFYWLSLYLIFLAMPNIGLIPGSVVLTCLVMGTFGYMITPGGVGLYPVIISATFAIFGLSKMAGYTAAWVAWSSQTMLFIVLGLASLIIIPIFYDNKSKKAKIKRN